METRHITPENWQSTTRDRLPRKAHPVGSMGDQHLEVMALEGRAEIREGLKAACLAAAIESQCERVEVRSREMLFAGP
jgi:hypothetical protein